MDIAEYKTKKEKCIYLKEKAHIGTHMYTYVHTQC